jgi:hypothetical protein
VLPLQWKLKTRKRLAASFALVFCLLGGVTGPQQPATPSRPVVSPQRHGVVSPGLITSVSLGRPVTIKTDATFRKKRAQAIALNQIVATVLQRFAISVASYHQHYLSADLAPGLGRSPPALFLSA